MLINTAEVCFTTAHHTFPDTGIHYFTKYHVLSLVTSWPCTWAEVVEVVVSSIREVPGEGAGINFGRGGGTGAQRIPPMKQILLLHPGGLLLLCRGETHKIKIGDKGDVKRKEEKDKERNL